MKKIGSTISRRSILKTFPASAAFALSSCGNKEVKAAVIPVKFSHGVASGDPLQDRVIIWTRITPDNEANEQEIEVFWEVATDEGFAQNLKSGTTLTNKDRDYTVKHDVTGLEAGKKYFYRFKVGNMISDIGETKTLDSSGFKPIRLAVASCSNYPWGYFNGYRAIAESGPFDAVIHLGDYIYEYADGVYGSKNAEKMGRLLDPPHEIITLSDYRRRHAQYKSDVDLQEAHRKHPFICAWDDHEFTNNSYINGAQNHNDNEGPWEPRKRAATKAYMEWMPVRVGDGLPTVRSFDFGKLATLAMLDTRIVGRERPLEYGRDVDWIKKEISDGNEGKMLAPVAYDTNVSPAKEITDEAILRELDENNLPQGVELKRDYAAFHKRLETEERSILGPQQEQWLNQTLARSKRDNIPWQILGQQVIMSYRPEPPLSSVFTEAEIKELPLGEQLSMSVAEEYGGFYNPDAWDGYQPARLRVLKMLGENANNPIVLTGDTHCAWAMSLTDKMGGRHYGAEFAVQGITSPGRGENMNKIDQVVQNYYDHLDHMAYASIKDRGFMVLDITKEASTASWYFLTAIESKNFQLEKRKSLKLNAGDCDDGIVILEDVPV